MKFADLKQNIFIKNLFWAFVVFASITTLAYFSLDFITNHNKEYEVPDLTNIPLYQAKQIATQQGFRVDVVDSIYVNRMNRGYVYKQNPEVGSMVKKGRRILLTINAVLPKKVKMPNLIGYSTRQAIAELSSRGLILGRLIYVSDIATNNVLDQIYKHSTIAQGKLIVSGAVIDLKVGLNANDDQTNIPKVIGMKYLRALNTIHESSLNVGKVKFSKNIKNYADSLDAVVVSQAPLDSNFPVLMGSEVSLHLDKPNE